MSVSHNSASSSRETRVLPGDLGASGGAAPLGGDMAAAGAEGGGEESGESESWAAAVPPVRPPQTHLESALGPVCNVSLSLMQEWVPIIRCDMMTQRKMKAQPPLSDAYLHGMPAKRRKVTGSGGGRWCETRPLPPLHHACVFRRGTAAAASSPSRTP